MALPTMAPCICRLSRFLEEPLCRLEGQRLEVWAAHVFHNAWGSGRVEGYSGGSQQGWPEAFPLLLDFVRHTLWPGWALRLLRRARAFLQGGGRGGPLSCL